MEYEEVETELEPTDYIFIGAIGLGTCLVIAFVLRQLRKTFKNIHLKIGNKIEVGIETKDDKK